MNAKNVALPDLPKRYLLVIKNLSFLYSHFWPMAEAARRAGWEVWIAADPNMDPQRILAAGMRFVPLETTSGIGSVVGEIATMWSLLRILRQSRPTVVHLIYLKTVILGGILARFIRVPAVLGAITGLGSLFVENRFTYKVIQCAIVPCLRFGYRNTNAILAFENRDDRQYFVERGVVPESSAVILPGAGVNPEAYQATPPPNGVPVILFVGRMIRNKGVDTLVDACRILRTRGTPFNLWLAGGTDPGNPTTLTESELRRVETDGIGSWLGHRTDVDRLLQQSAIFCLPTHYREGLPRVLIEAGAAGRPAVTADVPGCREIIRNGINGVIVPPKAPQALADALEHLIRNPELRASMGDAAYQIFLQEYTLSSVLEALNRCYRSLNVSLRVSL